MSQRVQPLGMGNIRIWVGTQEGDEYSKDTTGMLEHGTGTGTRIGTGTGTGTKI